MLQAQTGERFTLKPLTQFEPGNTMNLFVISLIAIGITLAIIMSPRLLMRTTKRTPDARAIRHFGMGGGGL